MATASKTSGTGSGDTGNSERDKKYEKMKKEIRSILQTAAKQGLTPDQLDRDYRDLNGRPINYRDLGFLDLFSLLDSMQDAIDAYDTGGEVVLFAKSTESTRHLEHLISKAKNTRLGRFGGIIQTPPDQRKGTPERRKLIEKRLIEIAADHVDYVSYYDLYSTYQARFREPLDTKADFNCQAKALFTIKLDRIFDVKASTARGSGQFSVRLKDEFRNPSAMANGHAAAENFAASSNQILGPGGFGQHQGGPTPPQFMPMPSFHSANENRENTPPMSPQGARTAPFHIRPEQLFMLQRPPYPPMQMTQAPIIHQSMDGMGIRVHQVPPMHPMFAQLLQPSSQQPRLPPPGAHPYFIGPPAMYFPHQQLIHPAHIQQLSQSGMIPMQHFNYGAPVNNHQQQQYTIQQQTPFPQSDQETRPQQTGSNDSAIGLTTPSDTPLDINAPAFELRTMADTIQQQPTAEEESQRRAPKVPALPPANELFPDVDITLSPTTASAPPGSRITPQSTPKSATSNASTIRSPGPLQLRLNPDQEATSENAVQAEVTTPVARVETSESNGALATASTSSHADLLKEECKKVLRRHPSGIHVLGFEKAYKDTTGKDFEAELNLLPELNCWSAGELAEVWVDLFEQKETDTHEVLLFEKRVMEAGNSDQEAGAAGGVDKDQLIAELWDIAMGFPDANYTLVVQDIPQIYESKLGRRFPVTADLDKFWLDLYDYTEAFEFRYVSGGILITAQPNGVGSRTKIGDQASGTSESGAYANNGESYNKQSLPISAEQFASLDQSDPNRYIEVYMAQVLSPGWFFIQLKSTNDDFETLLNQMNVYFMDTKSNDDAKVPHSEIKAGLPCACLSTDEDPPVWYRAVVKDTTDIDYITVLLVDYGTEIETSLDSIRYLPRQFFAFPSQAIEAKLAFMLPLGEAWSSEAGDHLTSLCGQSKLCAEVYKIDEDGILHIMLTVLHENGEETHINDELENAGMARLDELALGDTNAESGIHLDLEDEIESPHDGNSPDSVNGAEHGSTAEEDVAETPEAVLDTSTEEQIVEQLRLEENLVDNNIPTLARTYFCRRRKAINNLLAQSSDENINRIAVDKLFWFEQQIKWLNTLCDK